QPSSSSSSTHRLPGARPRNPGDAFSPCRRGDRVATLFCCDRSQPHLSAAMDQCELLKRTSSNASRQTAMSKFANVVTIEVAPGRRKKPCKQSNGSEQMWRERAAGGYESKVCLILPVWCSSTRLPSARTWRD